jgi:hypothetical protein
MPRRFAFLLVVVLLSLTIFSCPPKKETTPTQTTDTTTTYKPPQQSGGYKKWEKPYRDAFCDEGNYSPSHPLICVDSVLKADPLETHVFQVEPKNDKPGKTPVVVHWFSQKTSDLIISFSAIKENTAKCVVKEPECDHRGHCWATVSALKPYEQWRVCKYSVTLGKMTYDPEGDLIVNPCCWISPDSIGVSPVLIPGQAIAQPKPLSPTSTTTSPTTSTAPSGSQ